jgi:hypothetical protein
VLGKGPDALYLSATFLHQDPYRPAPPTLELIFISASPTFKYRERHDLVLYLDGRQRSFAEATHYQSRADGHGTAWEAARITLTYDDLLTLTRCRRVAARLGTTEFELTNNHLEALRELVSLMAPPPGRWHTDE